MISTGELKRGVTIELDNELFKVLDYQHIKMGRGSAVVRLKLRNVRSGYTVERTFQNGEKFARARLDQDEVEYLYKEGDLYYFMNTETYDQFPLSADILGDAVNYLKENMKLQLLSYQGEAIEVELPITVELRVEKTDPGFKGDTASGGSKPATLETGLTINVPLFINEGDVLQIDTRTGMYLQRLS